MVALKIGVPVGDPWVIGEPGTSTKRWQKKMAEKKNILKDGRKHHFSSSTTNQQSINNQSDIQSVR